MCHRRILCVSEISRNRRPSPLTPTCRNPPWVEPITAGYRRVSSASSDDKGTYLIFPIFSLARTAMDLWQNWELEVVYIPQAANGFGVELSHYWRDF